MDFQLSFKISLQIAVNVDLFSTFAPLSDEPMIDNRALVYH